MYSFLGFPIFERKPIESSEPYIDRVAHKAVPWSDDIKHERELVILGETFKPRLILDVDEDRHPFSYINKVLPRGKPLDTYRSGGCGGKVRFTTDVTIPVLRNLAKQKIVMSVTPMEILTLRPGVKFSRGHVILDGLGLGWMLDKICQRPSVKSVTVVERSQLLLDWFGKRLCDEQQKVKEVVCDDVFKYLDRTLRIEEHCDTRIVLDVWNSYRHNKQEYRVRELKKKFPWANTWVWG